jgi:hypothetical protein
MSHSSGNMPDIYRCSINTMYDIIMEEPSDREPGGTKYTMRNGKVLYFRPNQKPVSCNGNGSWNFEYIIKRAEIPLGAIRAETA